MKYKKPVSGLLLLIVGIILFYNLLFGKLFPLSPLAIGFDKHELKNVIIYIQNGSDYNNYNEINNFTTSVEKFHNLKFIEKPRIYIFSDKDSYLRRNITKARFYAYPNNKLVVSSWAIDESKKGILSLEIYIKHELSHIILCQNMSYLAAYNYPKWLMEGIAVYSVNQMGTSWYPSKKKTFEIIKSGDYFPTNLYKTKNEDSIKINTENRIAFMYSEFGCIVDFLIEKYGKVKFDNYMKGLFVHNNHDAFFKEIYGINFSDSLNEFINNAKR